MVSYFQGDSLEVSQLNEAIALEPGQFLIFTTKKLSKPDITARVKEYSESATRFQVYPNPSKDRIYMDPLPEKSRLSILQSSGQVVMEKLLNEYQDQVDLSSLPPGLYVLIRQSGNQAPEYAKVIRE